jgi:hypothetical protein
VVLPGFRKSIGGSNSNMLLRAGCDTEKWPQIIDDNGIGRSKRPKVSASVTPFCAPLPHSAAGHSA